MCQECRWSHMGLTRRQKASIFLVYPAPIREAGSDRSAMSSGAWRCQGSATVVTVALGPGRSKQYDDYQ